MGSFWAKYTLFELKTYIGVIFHETEEGYKIWRGIDLSFQNWHKEFDKFWPKQSKVSKSFNLMGFFWAKYILFEIKKYRRVIFHETEKGYKIWKGIDLQFQNWDKEFDKCWPKNSKASKNFTLIGSFWAKHVLFELKKYRGVFFHQTEEGYKIWRETDLLLGKWHEEFGKFSPEHSKVSKLELWWDSFAQTRKCMTLKFTEELCVMTMKNDAKIEEKLTFRFKIHLRDLTSFHPSTRKSKNFVF